jgi:hypothetical protein
MTPNMKLRLAAAAIGAGMAAYGHYSLYRINRTIAKNQKRMAEQTFTLIIPVPPQF